MHELSLRNWFLALSRKAFGFEDLMLLELFGGSSSWFNETLNRDFTTRFHALLAVNIAAKQVIWKTSHTNELNESNAFNCTEGNDFRDERCAIFPRRRSISRYDARIM